MPVPRRELAHDRMWEASDFVGREDELDKIVPMLVHSTRLITLIGSGGIGKTRLAVQAVGRYQMARHVSVHWVRLARLSKGSDAYAVEEEIAQSVIGPDFSGRSVWEALVDTFTEVDAVGQYRQSILVMDNCEHVLAGAGAVITPLLETVPGLSILATSREPIGWVDEHLIVVPPLSRRQALTLFRQRSELTGHPVTGADQIATADLICRHMHDHPLYIRLAAARLVRQPLAAILGDLSGDETDDKRMRWSPGPSVGADPRHRGVGDVIAWSYDLCTDKERLLFERMSVFAAGYDTNPEDDHSGASLDVGAELDAIESVCADDRQPGEDRRPGDDDHPASLSGDGAVSLASEEIEDLLDRLVDRSLVTAHFTTTTVRYSLLESLRIFARRQLEQHSTVRADESARLAERHRHYYRDKVAYAAANWLGPAEHDLLDWARAAWDNILTAIDTSITTPGEAAVGLEICSGLLALRFPFMKGPLREMRRWTTRSLQATRTLDPQPAELQIGAMAMIVWLTLCQGEPEDAERMLEDCVTACFPDTHSRRNWRSTAETDIGLPAVVEFAWGIELLLAHGDARAITVLARAREKWHRLDNYGAAVMADLWAALAAGVLGTAQQAHQIARHHLDEANASGALWVKSWAQLAWALTLTRHGNPTAALDFERQALTHQLPARDPWGRFWAVQFRAWSLAQCITDAIAAGNPDRDALTAWATEIAQLAGGTATQQARFGIRLEALGPFADEADKALAVARRTLGPEAFTAAETQGSRLRPELDEVQQLAMGTLSINTLAASRPAGRAASSYWNELTTAEQEVAILAAARWTNAAIAARRGNSVRTIDAQMTTILQKLNITSREDIIGFVPEDIIDDVRAETARRPRRGKTH
ncbi:hypothetical protein OH799_35505 [Nocardia sp. NBC_00881]|uniref:ATP-binding protein n=1 Tax=Nocardia sp. NBC_00881 TaxID=2975995 RepID=UPI0038638CCB|nr:hypothetical protein OH799_35505 [Nocardia sp. NBC_00881]